MSAGVEWTEVVTTALLGTDRRPLPAPLRPSAPEAAAPVDPTVLLLDAAARHRAATRATCVLRRCPAPAAAPVAELPDAPEPAQQLLRRLLVRPLPELVNAWLVAAAARSVVAAAQTWAELAGLAAHRPDYDRALLARALGGPGRWFLQQNQAWSGLAAAVEREAAALVADGAPPAVAAPAAAAPLPTEAEVRARPEVVLDVPAPWPREVSVAALRVLLGGALGWRATRYASSVGARMATEDHDLLQQARDALPADGRGVAPGLRLVADALLAAAQSAAARAEIDAAFDPPGAPTALPERGTA